MNSDSAITGAGMVKNLFRKFWIAALVSLFAGSGAFAHPHVFVEASLEIVLDKDGRFSKLRQVWRFDELFSATVVLDFDEKCGSYHVVGFDGAKPGGPRPGPRLRP